MRFLAILILLPILAQGVSAAPRGPTDDPFLLEHMLLQGEVVDGDWETPPPADANWRPVTMPDVWRHSGRTHKPTNAWYRFGLERPQSEGTPYWAVYLLRVNLNASVWLNGIFIGDGGRFSEPVARNWNRPLLFDIPPSLWQDGTNELLVRLRAQENRGALAPPLVAPTSALKPLYDARLFRQVVLSEAFFFVTLAIALFMLSLWLRRRRDAVYLWFGLAAACWSLFNLHMFIRNVPIDATLWWKSVHLSIDAWAVCLMLFIHRLAGRHRPRLEQAGLGFVLIGGTWYFAAPTLDAFSDAFQLWHLGGVMITAYMMLFAAVEARQQRRTDLVMFALGLGVLFVLAFHDWHLTGSKNIADWVTGYHLMPQATPLIFVLMTWHLTGRFIQALNQAEHLNARLEERVAHARWELARSYAEQQALERDRAATQERERIYSDLHDDLGAKLLTLVYRAPEETTADLARSALQDLRDVVSRSPDDALQLDALLSDWRSEAQQRLDLAGIQLEWRQNDDTPGRSYPGSGELAFNLGRVLREALSNILKHAGASRVSIRIDVRDERLRIEIADNGRGCGGAPLGRGIGNMQKRVRNLRGELHGPLSDPEGCRIVVDIPLAIPAT